MKNTSAKIVGILCGVTILSGCSSSDDWKHEKVNSQRHAPALNAGGTGEISAMAPTPPAPPMDNMPVAPSYAAPQAMPVAPVMPPAPIPQPQAPLPPQSQAAPVSTPGHVVVTSNTPTVALPADRRPPEFNRAALSSPDLASAVPSPMVTQSSLAPVPPAPPSAITSPVPPPPPIRADGYPQLSNVPPSPPVPEPGQYDPRVQQMKQDLSSMQQAQAIQQGTPPKVIVRSVATGAGPVPQVQQVATNGTPNNPAIPTTQASLPGTPGATPLPAPTYNAPTPPAPPAYQQQASIPAAPSYNVPVAANKGLMPSGPTVVVHSSKSGMANNTQMASYTPPPVPSFAPAPPPPPPAGFSQLPPPVPQAGNLGSVPPAPIPPREIPVPAPAPKVASTSLQPPAPPAYAPAPMTSPSMLHPIAAQPVGPGVTVASNAPVSSGYTDPSSLQPIANTQSAGGYKLLPESRYAKYRRASNNSYYDTDQ